VPAPARRRREELLDQLVSLFLAEGFRHLTLADLSARLHCSKSTLYGLGQTKEQVTANVVRHFFRMATGQVESAIPAQAPPGERIAAYLHAIGDALRPASAAFMADLAAQDSAREIYQQNTAIAARRVAELIAEGVASGEFRPVHASFIADTAAATMARIQSGAILAATGLGDADAYDELAALLLDGIRERTRLPARIEVAPLDRCPSKRVRLNQPLPDGSSTRTAGQCPHGQADQQSS
jgi:AcrR family transcriptional regulator